MGRVPTDSAGETEADLEGTATASPHGVDRVRAAVAAVPFLAVGLFNLLLILLWGADYLWGFVVLIPVVFMSALAWIAFRESRG